MGTFDSPSIDRNDNCIYTLVQILSSHTLISLEFTNRNDTYFLFGLSTVHLDKISHTQNIYM